MVYEEELKLRINNPDFLCITGSRLYGTETENSDYDYRGFTFPPKEAVLGVKNFKMAELEGDHKVYSIKHFLELAIKGDPSCIEMFFVPQDKIIKLSPLGNRILRLKDEIVSNKIFYKICGYSANERRKAFGTKIVVKDRTSTQEQLLNDIRNICTYLEKEEIDQIVELIEKGNKKEVKDTKAKIGAKRKEEYDKYGYGVTSAAHCIRLLLELKQLLTEGTMTFPLPEASYLKDIRHGKIIESETKSMVESLTKEVESLKEKSVLREKPDVNHVYNVYVQICEELFR